MFFSAVIQEAEHPPEAAGREIAVGVTFHGEPAGVMWLAIESDAARGMSANFLGVDPGEVSDDQVSEVICELSNMVCGAVLSRVATESVLSLDSPKPVPLEEISSGAGSRRWFALENGSLRVLLSLTTN